MAPGPRVHSSAFVGEQVTLGEDVVIGPGAVLLGPLRVGNRVWIGPNAVIGTPPEVNSLPQNAGWAGEVNHFGVDIGDGAVIRELSTIHQGSRRTTTIGRGTWLLNSVYVAHDSLIGAQVTLSAGVRVGGHSVIGDHANVGMNAAVHQRRIIGAGSMIGMGTPVTRDVPPFSKAYGVPIRRHGLNDYVLRKLGADQELIEMLAAAYAAGDYSLASFAAHPILSEIASWWGAQLPGRLLGGGSPA